MDPDGVTFNQYRLKSLYTEPVQSGCAIQHYRVILYDIVKNIPHFEFGLLDHLLCALDRVDKTFFF